MITYATDETFKELISGEHAMVDFFGVNCGPCKILTKVLEDIEEELPFANIVKVDTDKCPKTSEEFHIVGIPDVYFFKNGSVVFHSTGMLDADEIKEKLAEIMY
ncbi:MAG: thioredoxin domain-containing protein [Lachnospiraceae bacterium]|nr:thioredoxin domain-containing protein [Lachnospiraceae bacterium]